jgi:hypothetical protein
MASPVAISSICSAGTKLALDHRGPNSCPGLTGSDRILADLSPCLCAAPYATLPIEVTTRCASQLGSCPPARTRGAHLHNRIRVILCVNSALSAYSALNVSRFPSFPRHRPDRPSSTCRAPASTPRYSGNLTSGPRQIIPNRDRKSSKKRKCVSPKASCPGRWLASGRHCRRQEDAAHRDIAASAAALHYQHIALLRGA